MQASTPQADTYQHVVVVMSMVLGMAITQLLRGMAQLHRARARVRTYWLHWGWVTLLVVFSLLLWWTFWNYRGITEWNFLRFALYLSPIIVLYYVAAVAFPDPSDNVTALREYYYANRKAFFGAFALCGVLASAVAAGIRGLPLSDSSYLFRLGLVVFMLALVRSSNARVHAAVFVLCASLMVVFTILYHFRLSAS